VALYVCDLGGVARWEGDAPRARVLCEEGLALARAAEARQEQALATLGLGQALALAGHLTGGAAALLAESEVLYAAQGRAPGVAAARRARGRVAWRTGEAEQAVALLRASLATCRSLGERPGIAECLEGLAAVAAGTGALERAARMLGAAEALREAMGAPLPPAERPDHEATVRAARAGLRGTAFAAAWAAGRALGMERAMAEALDDVTPAPIELPRPGAGYGLTRRELEVLRLLAGGETDAAIAARLSISRRTVNVHVASLLGKTGCPNRAALTALAVRQGLA
jgi:non-specific serine/threonine protein kinase